MAVNFFKPIAVWVCVYCPLTYAEDIVVEVKVVATERAGAVGYLVEGKSSGGLGSYYSGKGPSSKRYVFGYRKQAIGGEDISCGSAILSKNSQVKLIVKGNQCYTVIN